MKIRLLTILLSLTTLTLAAQDNITAVEPFSCKLADAPRYSDDTGYGFDLTENPASEGAAPFFFSVRVPDGNYKVTVRLGDKRRAGNTTVRAESRRLMVDGTTTAKGEFEERTFIVNKRSPEIEEGGRVGLKAREQYTLNWDDRLTLEFNGSAPVCESVTVEPADPSTVTLYLCGDSTVTDQDNEPWASWGQMFPAFFDSSVAVSNHAVSGESGNTFIGARRLAKILSTIRPGDYLFVEFGHNDQKQTRPGSGAWYSYMTSLKTFIDEARLKGAHPVLLTPTRRRRFDAGGRSEKSHGEFPDAMRWLAAKENVPLIDLENMTGELYEALGVEDSKKTLVHYPAGSWPGQERELADDTHFNTFGAYQVARCVVEGVKALLPELASHLIATPDYSPSQPDDPAKFVWSPSPFVEINKPDGN